MAFRTSDPRFSYRAVDRRQGPYSDIRHRDPDYPTPVRASFGQEWSNRNASSRNPKYSDVESDCTSRATKDYYSSEAQEFRDRESREDSFYRSTAVQNISVEDEEQFLYGSEQTSSGFVKDYMHGQEAVEKEEAGDDIKTTEAERQDYDPTIENILKSIGFNVNLTQLPTQVESSVEKSNVSELAERDLPASASKADATVFSGGRVGSSKKINSILTQHESYEERARRYREEQTQLYAETSADRKVPKAAPEILPPASGRSSLELLQNSYDYDMILRETGKDFGGIDSRGVLKNAAAFEKGVVNSATMGSKSDTAAPTAVSRTLYEDFSDSDDNLSDLDKSNLSKVKKVAGKTAVHKQRPAGVDHSVETDLMPKSAQGKETKKMAVEPNPYISGADTAWSSGAEKFVRCPKEHDMDKNVSKSVKTIPTDMDPNGIKSTSGRVSYFGSKWDSPERVACKASDLERPKSETDVQLETKKVDSTKATGKRQAKIQSLSKELEKLKQENMDLMRRKQRGRFGHKDPELLENSRHQEKVSAEVDRLKKLTDEEFAKLDNRAHDKASSKEANLKKSSSKKKKVPTATLR